jgi:ribonucleoside-diphosphate reductase alpha chain
MFVKEHLGIIVDYNRDRLIPEKGLVLLTSKGFYKKDWETSPQEGFARAATCFSFGDYEFAQRIYDYSSKGWFTYASPVLSNAIEINWPTFSVDEFEEAGEWLEENIDADAQPISCFLVNNGEDTKEGLLKSSDETRRLSMIGGGLGIYMGNRSPDEKSTGVMAHLNGYDADALSYKQTATRRGSIGVYLDIDHPEIVSFIQMRSPTGGDANKKCFNLNNAVNIPDSFMKAVIQDEEYQLIDPKHGATGKFLRAREVWEELMQMRFETGEPYLCFIDTINRNLPSWITKPTYKVVQSNLCSEITLMTSAKRTAVCCLSSLNLDKFDEWKDTTIVEDLVRFLDNVLEYFIRLAPKALSRAVYSASKERAIGLGTLGYHSYLQSKMIPFESGGVGSAASETYKLYSLIKERAVNSSKQLARERGEAPDCIGSGMRNSHLLAIAPNASSSDMVGVSPSIEPFAANAFLSEGRAGSFLVKNPRLVEKLKELELNTDEIWNRIKLDRGSVQNIYEIPDDVKVVFKTFDEIDPKWIIELASIRQPFLCQSQSLNIKVGKDITLSEMSDIHMLAWAKGIKTLYYCRAQKPKKVSIGDEGIQQPLNRVEVNINFETCLSCEG